MLHSIFNFDSFFSSKRNQYRITRGALGDALKEVICIPYAIAKEYYNIEWNEPLIISSGKQKFSWLCKKTNTGSISYIWQSDYDKQIVDSNVGCSYYSTNFKKF
jgi:hypothetical protein